MEVFSKINNIKEIVKNWKNQGYSIGFVPTMGALHVGHASLIKKAKEKCDKVVVSVFVNPIQFGKGEDLDKYPKPFEQDKSLCESLGVDLIFNPTEKEMYPENNITYVTAPEFFKNKLCGLTRTGHFDGVTTVVMKLFNIVEPDRAFFGQKDAQQLIIIDKMCRDLNIPVKITGCPIIRDKDGLACSSRNTYLSVENRQKALSIHKALFKIKELYENSETQIDKAFCKAKKLLNKDLEIEYFEAYDKISFEKAEKLSQDTLIAIAIKINGIRLIDNIMF